MQNVKDLTMTICPQSADSRWVALDTNDVIISEGKTPVEVSEKAKEKTDNFMLMFVPVKGASYIF
jgi:hypothetical protein